MKSANCGKLLPGAEAQLQRTLSDLKKAADVLAGVQILPGPGCAVSEAQKRKVYPLDQVPALPLPGCMRDPCCACDYVGVVKG
jgi:hypothetical protein